MARRIASATPPRPPTWRLFFAIKSNDLEKAKVAISDGADVNHVDDPIVHNLLAEDTKPEDFYAHAASWRAQTPLTYAVTLRQPDFVRLLVEHGARLDLRDGWLKTPVETARQYNYLAMVNLLRSLGG